MIVVRFGLACRLAHYLVEPDNTLRSRVEA
jgi:hypothetical protein